MIRKNKGVTLIELIISLAILSIFISLTFSTLLFSSKSFDSQAGSIENLSNVRNAISYITREIRKSDSIDVTDNILTLNGMDIYKSENNTITKNGNIVISKIHQFSIVKTGSEIDIEIVSTDGTGIAASKVTSTIYVR
jgi:prepilin-type N-terminal cleavage/methylation domain-containing protein